LGNVAKKQKSVIAVFWQPDPKARKLMATLAVALALADTLLERVNKSILGQRSKQ